MYKTLNSIKFWYKFLFKFRGITQQIPENGPTDNLSNFSLKLSQSAEFNFKRIANLFRFHFSFVDFQFLIILKTKCCLSDLGRKFLFIAGYNFTTPSEDSYSSGQLSDFITFYRLTFILKNSFWYISWKTLIKKNIRLFIESLISYFFKNSRMRFSVNFELFAFWLVVWKQIWNIKI